MLLAILIVVGVSGALVGYQMARQVSARDDVVIVLGRYTMPLPTN
jgi:short-subunit dehydrogenase involved in D-alanine esterification of teichoic acids